MTATDHAVSVVHTAARAASDKLAQHIMAFDVSDQLAITDAFLLASAGNDRQVKSIVDEIEEKLRDLLPNATLHVLPKVGHLIHYERPGEAAELILQFLRVQSRGVTAKSTSR